MRGKTHNFGPQLNKLQFAITVVDVDLPDQPLIFVNDAFKTLTGYGEEVVGQNCRFLQGGADNEEPRAELRLAIKERRRTQVLIQNRHASGETFFNLLLVEPVKPSPSFPNLMVGSQFRLTQEVVGFKTSESRSGQNKPAMSAWARTQSNMLYRRTTAAKTAVRIVESWCVLQETKFRTSE